MKFKKQENASMLAKVQVVMHGIKKCRTITHHHGSSEMHIISLTVDNYSQNPVL